MTTASQTTRSGDHRWWPLIAVCLATFMLLLDITVVNVALPAIQRALDAGFEDLQWVIDAYALALAAMLLTAGSLADRYGRRRVFTLGLGAFAAASLLCALAPSPSALTLARGLQGVGGAMMFATSLALIGASYSGRDRGIAFGVWGAVTGFAVAVGPLVGGSLTEWLGWEWIFLVNLPIGAAAIAVTRARVDESRAPRGARLDVAGLVTFSAALGMLVFALIRANDLGWGSATIVSLLGAAALLLVVFAGVELRAESPMLDLRLFGKPAFAGAQVAAFALSASIFAMFLYLTLYIQNGLGYSPLETGLRFLPVSVLSFVVAPVAGRLSGRLPARAFLGAGLALIGVGLLLMRGLDPFSGWTDLLPGFVFAGIGIGLTNPPLASTAIAVVEPALAGTASGINSTFRQVGIATGIGGLGAAFQARVHDHVLAALAHLPRLPPARLHALAEVIASGGGAGAAGGPTAVPPDARAALADAVRGAFVSGLDEALLIAAIVALAGSLLAAILVRRRDFSPAATGGETARAEPSIA
jgi:EmrB/QacA subfamily drug resistance transporter